MITLTDIAYVRSGVADLDEAVRFATEIVGLEAVPGDKPGTAHLRADSRAHCITFIEGESGVLSSGFTVADADALADAEVELEAYGIRVERGDAEGSASRRVSDYIGFDDPWGNRVELAIHQQKWSDPVNYTRPVGITEFGHLCLDVPQPREAFRFWSKLFNVRVSDWVGDAACLMRIDEFHHKFALFQGDRPALCHVNFQVETFDDLMRNWRFLESRGVEIIMGPGRHPTSGSAFVYFRGPEGLTYEYATGTTLITDEESWTPRTFDPTKTSSIDMWQGPVAPTARQYQLSPDSDSAETATLPSARVI